MIGAGSNILQGNLRDTFSMTLEVLLEKLHKDRIQIWFDNNELKYKIYDIEQAAEIENLIIKNKGLLEEFFRKNPSKLEHSLVNQSVSTNSSTCDVYVPPPFEQNRIWNNNTYSDYPKEKCLHLIFEEQAVKIPDKIAVIDENDKLTYEELNSRANQLAHYLHSAGVGPEIIVAICMEKSVDLIVGLLAILKSGGAYLPLDPYYPSERLQLILEDSKASILITQSKFTNKISNFHKKIIYIDKKKEELLEDTTNLVNNVTPRTLAYVIYTSGSTGKPKGVLCQHESIVSRLYWVWRNFPFKEDEVCCLQANLSFVDAVWEIFGPLLYGIKLVIFPESVSKDPTLFINWLSQNYVTRVGTIPTFLQTILETDTGNLKQRLSNVRHWEISGESYSNNLIKNFKEILPSIKLLNRYGMTEATGIIYQELDLNKVAITYILGNIQIYILDIYQQPVSVDVVGEIYVGGIGLARGYLNRPDLTLEKFVPNPFAEEEKFMRLYRTGDLARYHEDGSIEFVGRIDNQIKIRGFRIELAEIENALSLYHGVSQVIAAIKEQLGNQYLIAYLTKKQNLKVISDSFSVENLRAFLISKLPDYMIPSYFIVLDKFPLNPNGKVDRNALPIPDFSARHVDSTYVAPQTLIEEDLCKIWSEVLKIKRIGVNDNFFELGGHSLLTIQVISRIKQHFNVDVTLRSLFEYPTVAKLSQAVSSLNDEKKLSFIPAITPVERTNPIPLSFAQERLWFLEQFLPGMALYNIPFVFKLRGILNIDALERALNTVVQRHESLRTIFCEENGKPHQIIMSKLTINLIEHSESFVCLQKDERNLVVESLIQKEANTPFNLSIGPLIRVKLLNLSKKENIFLITLHHIISDGWSSSIFFKELSTAYNSYCSKEEILLNSLPVQYVDFVYWQRNWLQTEVIKPQLDYWKKQLFGTPELLKLPTDRPRSQNPSYQGRRYRYLLSREIKDQLNQFAQKQQVSLFMVLLATFQILLSRYSGQKDIVIGTPGRVADLISRRKINLSEYKNVVLDEADRMLDMGFVDEIRKILEAMPSDRQSLFFSATFPPAIKNLCNDFLKEPITVSVKTRDTASRVDQDVIRVSPSKR